MSREQAKHIIEGAGRCGYLASATGGQPRVRAMAFVVRDDLTLWSSTHKVSGKVTEFDRNPLVEVCFDDADKNQLRVTGILSMPDDRDKKAQLLELNPGVKKHFADADDPAFVLLEIRPTFARWKERGFCEYQDIDLNG